MVREFHPHCLRLLSLLRSGHVERARDLLDKDIGQHSPEWAYLHLLMPAVYLTGDLFVKQKIDAAACDRLTEKLFALMEHTRGQLRTQPRLGKTILATHLPGYAHSVGLIAICHWLERDGWTLIRPLPVPPLEELTEQIVQVNPDLLAISCSLPRQVLQARRLIAALRGRRFTAPIWIGGTPINASPAFFSRSGADHTARDILAFTRALAGQYAYTTATPASLSA